jgi:hypothetical protein
MREWRYSSTMHYIEGVVSRKSAGNYWIGGWVRPKTGLDIVERKNIALPGIESRPSSP